LPAAILDRPLLDFEARFSFAHLQAESIQYRIAIGPRAGRKENSTLVNSSLESVLLSTWKRSLT